MVIKVQRVTLSDVVRTHRAMTKAALEYARLFHEFSDGTATDVELANAEAAFDTAALTWAQAKMSPRTPNPGRAS